MKGRTKFIVAALIAVLAACAVVYGQTRLTRRTARVEITDAGAVSISPKSGQGVSVTGNTAVTGTLSATGAASAPSLNLAGTTLLDVPTNTASLNCGATAAGTCDALTITVTGAADGDP